MSSEEQKVIVVRKKKSGGHGEHGGAWKVAYADFVTAMMAFFLVMWIMGMDQGVKDMVEGYFSNPVGFKKNFSGGNNPVASGSDPTSLDLKRAILMTRDHQRKRFEQTAEEIRSKMEGAGLIRGMDAAVEVVVTEQGLRIELMETGEGETFFDKASAHLKPALRSVLALVAPELHALPNDVVVEGHTDALPFRGGPHYTNWDLSSDRANAARRVLAESGLGEGRVTEVRGYADRELKNPDDPLDPRNRRISVLLPFQDEYIIEEFVPVRSSVMSSASLPEDHLPQPDEETP
jgi:chemotaxis protein MotB